MNEKIMNSKFIRILVIINGILIPIFILLMIGSFLTEVYWKPSNNTKTKSEKSEKVNREFEVKYSSPMKIPNSENYFVAISKKYKNLYSFDLDEETLDLVPKNTVNIIFLDKEFNVIGKLLEKGGSISSMLIPNFISNKENVIKNIKYISYYIANEDTNKDGIINRSDQHYVYVSNLNGKNLTKITDRIVKQYQWINNNCDLLLTFKNKNNTENLIYGVYNIKNKTITETKSLNPSE
ncbi:MAG: hypothetical protein QM499_01320 [Flavobacteriaceae bacterium]